MASQNESALAELLARKTEVEVDGVKFHLSSPPLEAAIALRDRLMSAAGASEERGARLQVDLCVDAISLTAGLAKEPSERLFLASGGEAGPLCKAAVKLCGMDILSRLGGGASDSFLESGGASG